MNNPATSKSGFTPYTTGARPDVPFFLSMFSPQITPVTSGHRCRMKRDARQFEPQVTRVGNAPSRVRFTLKCHQCPTKDYVDGGRVLPDDVVSKKFKQRGWLLGRNRGYDVCPKCLGVTKENALANVFKVTDANGPVPSAAEIAAGAADAQRKTVSKTHEALDRLLGKAAEKPKADGCGYADRLTDPLLTMIAHDMAEVRAGLEQLIQGNIERNDLLKRQMEIADAQRKGHQRHLEYFERLMDHQERQNRAQEQLIRAIANIVPTVVRTSEGMTAGVREALAEVVESLLPRMPMPAPRPIYPPEAELGIPADETEDILLMPAAVQTVEPVPFTEPIPEGAKNFERIRASATVASYEDGRKPGHYLTHISMDREIWDAMGYTEDDRFQIKADPGIVIRKVERGGVKPLRIGTKTVVFQKKGLGDLQYERLHISIGFGEIRL